MATTYLVTARTGKDFGAGTDAKISITLIGDGGESGPHVLDKRLHDDFERGAVDAYQIEGADVGEIAALRVKSEFAFDDDWQLEELSVTQGGRTWHFPYFRWVRANTEVLIPEGTARLPQKARSKKELELRREQIERRRAAYTWRANDGSMPGSLDISEEHPLPIDEHYRDLGERNYIVTYAETMSSIKFSAPLIAGAWNALEKCEELLEHLGLPKVASRWRDDVEFARAMVQGVSPVHLRLAREVPAGMTFGETEAYGLLEPGMTLAQALADKRVYLLDLGVLEGIPMFSGEWEGEPQERFAPPSRTLLFRAADGDLHPIAIQLGNDPALPVFTPKDDENDWLAARLYVRAAEGSVHQIIAHAVSTHFSMEPFVLATMRNLSSKHPVYKLMRRHFRYTLAINEGARNVLLKPKGAFDAFIATGGGGHMKLAVKAWAGWKLAHARLPDDLAARGVDDTKALPHYPYRDDAKPIWDAMGDYVRETLRTYYESDADIVADTELADFWQDLTTNGMPVSKLPCAKLERFDDLADMLHTVMFNVSVGHSVVNNLQFEHYGWLPNAPLATYRPPPTKKGTLTRADVIAMMPGIDASEKQIAIGKALATFGKDEEFLLQDGGWNRTYFQDPAPLAAQQRFFTRMREHVARVAEANRHRKVPYDILSPDRIPCSVTL